MASYVRLPSTQASRRFTFARLTKCGPIVLFQVFRISKLSSCDEKMVVEASKKFLPTIAVGFNDPRVKVHIRDGFEFMKEHKNEFDVIITDSSDPDGALIRARHRYRSILTFSGASLGPASTLFGEAYFQLTKEALTANGCVGVLLRR